MVTGVVAKLFLGTCLVALVAIVSLVGGFFVLLDNNRNSELLIECTTPGDGPPPVTGNDCWDRLHDPEASGTADAVTTILIESDCRARRLQAALPAPDPAQSCLAQTPGDVYPGV
jgi:hypothetical protein